MTEIWRKDYPGFSVKKVSERLWRHYYISISPKRTSWFGPYRDLPTAKTVAKSKLYHKYGDWAGRFIRYR